MSVAELFAQTITSGKITLNEQRNLQAALLQNGLSDDDRSSIDRMLYAVRRGWVQTTQHAI